MTYDEMLAVIQAAKLGKPIEAKRNDGSNIPWTELQEVGNFNFMEYEYRVKKEPKYRPFKNADEAFQEAKKHGFWCCISKDEYRLVSFIDNTFIELANELAQHYDFRQFLDFHWADTGELCGILEK